MFIIHWDFEEFTACVLLKQLKISHLQTISAAISFSLSPLVRPHGKNEYAIFSQMRTSSNVTVTDHAQILCSLIALLGCFYSKYSFESE